MGFPRQEYWSCLPLPSPGNLPNSGIKPASPELAGGFFNAEPPGKPLLPLQYLITACLLLCICHWTVGSKRAEPSSFVQMVYPAPVSKLGIYWMANHTYKIVLDWMEKHKNHSWKSFKAISLSFLPCTPVLYTCTHTDKHPSPYIHIFACLHCDQPQTNLCQDHTSQSYRESNLNIHWKDWCWSWSCSSNTLAIWCEELTH